MRENKRLFVGNLPPNATDSDLRSEFSAYGKVISVDVKTKEGNTNSDKSNKFGFVNIELDDYMTRQCIQEFKETAYKGFYLTVSVAKESFLDKLKREREEAAAAEAQKQEEQTKRPKYVEVESEEFVIKPSKFKSEPVHTPIGDDEDSAFKKRSKGAYFENGKVKILGGTGNRLHANDEDTGNPNPNGNASEANQKRLESLHKLKQAHDQQKYAIKNALKMSEAPKNKKIVFDSEEAAGDTWRNGKSNLFDGDDDDGDYSNDFKSRKQFEGAQGQKLLELKSKFRNDDRFRMDEDFHEEEGGEAEDAKSDDEQGERKRQLEILGSVVGKSFDSRKKKSTLPATMLRFDPSKATHQKFYQQRDQTDEADDTRMEDDAEDIDMPKVSADQFYKVSNKIGDAMKGESQGFSLLKMMGHQDDEGGDNANNWANGAGYRTEPLNAKQRKAQSFNENPFKYDSDDETGARKQKPAAAGNQNQSRGVGKAAKVGGKTNKRGIFRENFFILDGDARLEQGLAFFAEGPRDKARNFLEIKKRLKKVVNMKVRKNKLMQKGTKGGGNQFKRKK